GDTSAPSQQTGVPWFTPAYASPEQLKRERVGTAADVYALGALLHEVLTDTTPAPDAEGRLPQPSRASGLAVDRELDLIVAKATHPEQERRYASAAALAEDLQRYLRGRPVHAAPDSLRYRVAKFVGRHRLASVTLLAAVVLAGLFTWRLARERDRALRAEAVAQQQSATAESVVEYLVSLFRSASPEETGTQPIAPRDLVDRGRHEIDERLADAPQQHARLLGALSKIYLELGLSDEAAEAAGKAADIERLHGTPRQRAAYLADQGFALNLSERPGSTEPILLEAIALLGEVTAQDRKLASEILSTLGLAQARNGDPGAGEASVRRALDYATGSDGSNSVAYARSLYALAETEMRGNRLDQAEADARRSIALMRSLLPDDSPDVISATGFLTQIQEQKGNYAEGERLLRGMLETRLRTLAPGSDWALTTRNNLAQMIQLQGRIVEATALLQENLDLMRTNHQQDSASYVIGLNNVASLLEQAGDYAAALPMFREVLDKTTTQSDLADNPRLPLYRQNLGRNLMLNGKLDEARPLLEAPIEGHAESQDFNVERARRLVHLAEWMRRSHRLAEALDYADQGTAAFTALFPPTHPRLGGAARTRGLILRDQQRLAEAESELRRAADILAGSAGRDSNITIDTEINLAEVLFVRGKADEARALHTRVAPLLESRFVAKSALRAQHAALGKRLADATTVAMH
ncbi:tetratricopeptide repeat protein, partial [Dokdonella sp.]|uniref:tetratricopeptide repeat protein n=1 Tax=Dokdonella sp. TaxID=2291710 RepID=UPI00262D0312